MAPEQIHPKRHNMSALPSFAIVPLLAMARMVMQQQPSQVLGPEGDIYLRRWWLEKNPSEGSLYIHHMLRSDQDEEFHDHPAENLSIILKGQMIEHTPGGKHVWNAGDMVVRKAEDRHRVEIERPLITLWAMGPKIRDWGFWRESDGKSEFILSQEFFKEKGYF